eukprot:TRINITY_DN6590_c1_g1_i2.p1 TRINITY_DN6590_c1_g1~~TRINITY_DN6590_c1_g1_i2.p1  ORF type:complete len:1380 (+),score=314.84 TRINITY_DN6590_c1_g1_i2:3265-7404(+)
MLSLEAEVVVGADSIKRLPMFATAAEDPAFLHFMLSGLEPQSFCAGEQVMRKGDEGYDMFFLIDGSVGVMADDGSCIVALGRGTFFGEIALLNSCRRTATLQALSHCSCFRLGQEVFQEAEELFPVQIALVRDHAGDRLLQIKLAEIVERCPLFADFATDTDFISEVVGRLRMRSCVPGQVVLRQGEYAKEMNIVSRGELSVLSDEGELLFAMGSGCYFGEVALVYNMPASATVVASDYSDLYVLSRSDFKEVETIYPEQSKSIAGLAQEQFHTYITSHVIAKASVFAQARATPGFLALLMEQMSILECEPGQVLCEQGKPCANMYFVARGALRVEEDGAEVQIIQDGGSFGDVHLFDDAPCAVTLLAAEETEVFVLAREDFIDLVAPRFPEELRQMEQYARERALAAKVRAIVTRVPLFESGQGNSGFLDAVCKELRHRKYQANEVVFRQNDMGDEMFFVIGGEVQIFTTGFFAQQEKRVGELREGDYMGEAALVWNSPRTCTMRVAPQGPAELFALSTQAFARVNASFPELAQQIEQSWNTRYQATILADAVKKVPLFKEATEMNEHFAKALAGHLRPRMHESGELVVKAGEEATELLYVSHGTLRILDSLAISGRGPSLTPMTECPTPGSGSTPKLRKVLGVGDYFGEVSLVYSVPHHADIVALSKSRLFVLSRSALDEACAAGKFTEELELIRASARARFMPLFLCHILKSSEVFGPVTEDLAAIAKMEQLVEFRTLESGAVVARRGERETWMGMILTGRIHGDGYGTFGHGKALGEACLFWDAVRPCSLVAQADTELIVLTRAMWERLAAELPDTAGKARDRALAGFRRSPEVLAAVRGLRLLQPCRQEEAQRVAEALVAHVTPCAADAKQGVTQPGDEVQGLWLVVSGELGRLQSVCRPAEDICPGGACFEWAVAYDTPSPHACRAKMASNMCTLARDDFQRVMACFPESLTRPIEARLRQMFQTSVLPDLIAGAPLLRAVQDCDPLLAADFYRTLADAMISATYGPSHVVMGKGDSVDTAFFVARGKVVAFEEGNSTPLDPGTWYAMESLVTVCKCPWTIVVGDNGAEVFTLRRGEYKRVCREFPLVMPALVQETDTLMEQAVANGWVGDCGEGDASDVGRLAGAAGRQVVQRYFHRLWRWITIRKVLRLSGRPDLQPISSRRLQVPGAGTSQLETPHLPGHCASRQVSVCASSVPTFSAELVQLLQPQLNRITDCPVSQAGSSQLYVAAGATDSSAGGRSTGENPAGQRASRTQRAQSATPRLERPARPVQRVRALTLPERTPPQPPEHGGIARLPDARASQGGLGGAAAPPSEQQQQQLGVDLLYLHLPESSSEAAAKENTEDPSREVTVATGAPAACGSAQRPASARKE